MTIDPLELNKAEILVRRVNIQPWLKQDPTEIKDYLDYLQTNVDYPTEVDAL